MSWSAQTVKCEILLRFNPDPINFGACHHAGPHGGRGDYLKIEYPGDRCSPVVCLGCDFENISPQYFKNVWKHLHIVVVILFFNAATYFTGVLHKQLFNSALNVLLHKQVPNVNNICSINCYAKLRLHL